MTNPLNSKSHILSGLARVYTRLDTMLAGRPVLVEVAGSGPAPAWSHRDYVYLNEADIHKVGVDDVLHINGLNYHELAHILFSPDTPFARSDRVGDIRTTLEESRIETLLTQRWPSTSTALSAAVLRWVLHMGDSVSVQRLLLVAGRAYLPQSVRDAAAAGFPYPDILPRVLEICEEHRHLNLPSDEAQALRLAMELDDILPKDEDLPEHPHGPDSTVGDSPDMVAQFPEALEALRAVQSSPDAAKEAKATREQARSGDTKYSEQKRAHNYIGTKPVPPAGRVAARRFEEELRTLQQQAEAGWDRRTSSGRLNIDRYIGGADPSEMFDIWDEGTDGYDLEVTSLIDTSSSMHNVQHIEETLGQMAWVIERAVKEIEGGCRTYTFNDHSRLLYGPLDIPSPTQMKVPYVSGSTRVAESLLRAEDIMSTSRRQNKVVIVVTDGAWHDHVESDRSIQRMQARGVTVAVAYIHTAGTLFNPVHAKDRHSHGADFFMATDTPSDLVKWAKGLIKHLTSTKGHH